MESISEEILRGANNNIRTTLEELRKRIIDIPSIIEIIEDRNIIYRSAGERFCVIKIRKDYLEIDFRSDKLTEDPIEFSWKIKPTGNSKFNRRMQLKNNNNINLAFELIFQAYNMVK